MPLRSETYWNIAGLCPRGDRSRRAYCRLLSSCRFPEHPLCIHDKESRELYKCFEDVFVDADLDDGIEYFPTTLYTVGKRPSCDIGDALVRFTTNGAEYVKHRYTVLGVNIGVPNVDLDYFNLLSDELGMPMLVGTNVLSSVLRESDGAPSQNLRSAPILDLKCNVGLKSGVVRLSLGKVKGHFKVVAVGKNNDVTVLMDTAESKQVQWKLEDWWKLVDSEAKIRLVAVTRGSCDVHFSYGTVQNNQLYRDAVSQRFTAVYPLILPDYNRDGKIDDEDAYSYQNKILEHHHPISGHMRILRPCRINVSLKYLKTLFPE